MKSNQQKILNVAPSVESGRSECRYPWISQAEAKSIGEIDHFKDSEYRSTDLNELLSFYVYNFVEPLIAIINNPRSIADIGAGYGWLAIAFALRTQAKIVAVEKDEERLAAAQKIAKVLGVESNIEWKIGSISELPLHDRSFDAVYCVEVIEHTGVNQSYIRELARITDDILVITTPNKFFPILNHDTALPFCHWLPLRQRDFYANRFKRSSMQQNNMFWSPFEFLSALDDFDRVSCFLQFRNYKEYRKAKIFLNSSTTKLSAQYKEYFFFLISKLGKHSIFFVPNLASTFRRRR